MAVHTHEPDPETPEKGKRRNFTAADKLRILAQLDKAAAGQQGAIMRRLGIYGPPTTGSDALGLGGTEVDKGVPLAARVHRGHSASLPAGHAVGVKRRSRPLSWA